MLQTISALGQKYSVEILEATDEPRSAKWLSEELDVPIATCYRRVQTLADVGLVKEVELEAENGQQKTGYKRSIDHVEFRFSPSLSINTTPRVEDWMRNLATAPVPNASTGDPRLAATARMSLLNAALSSEPFDALAHADDSGESLHRS
ncbi:ArsR family transcriptional regulator [Halobellus sp. Atlit-31R]|nr:ArsR family transcriptional regulator [Halobellus sp. Atlit-31R]